jgi:hypothetical protein
MSMAIEETMNISGLIKIYEWPSAWSVEEIVYWTLPEVNEHGEIIRPARLSPEEIARHQAAEFHNILTTSGRTQVLQFIGNNTGTSPFGQYLSVGTFPINSVSPGDTAVNTEIYRQVPNTTAITGTQNDLATVFGTNTAPGAWTNCGLWGINATATANSGTLMTHALLSYTKVNGTPVTIDYIISLN